MKLIPVSANMWRDTGLFDLEDGRFIFGDPKLAGPCVNHSCDPNIAIQGQIVFVAMRGIEAGEELTHDWATTDDLDYEMACNCGSSDCRRIVTGKDWMDKALQAKYRGWFCWFLQRKIEATTAG